MPPTFDAAWSYAEAYDRNRGLIPDEHQEKLRHARVALAGLGGVGGVYATTLARLGVGHFSIADPDLFEVPNINRQQGASVASLGEPKNATVERLIKDINPTAEVGVYGALTEENIDTFLDGVTVALDGIDFFAIDVRRLLYRACRERTIPVLGAAPIGFGASMLNFSPSGMSFDEYMDITDTMTAQEQILQFAIGIAPRMLQRPYFSPTSIDFAGERAPSSVLGTLACANLVGTEAYKVIVGLPYESAPTSWHVDPYVRKMKRCVLWGGNKNPIQRFKKWYFIHILKLK